MILQILFVLSILLAAAVIGTLVWIHRPYELPNDSSPKDIQVFYAENIHESNGYAEYFIPRDSELSEQIMSVLDTIGMRYCWDSYYPKQSYPRGEWDEDISGYEYASLAVTYNIGDVGVDVYMMAEYFDYVMVTIFDEDNQTSQMIRVDSTAFHMAIRELLGNAQEYLIKEGNN